MPISATFLPDFAMRVHVGGGERELDLFRRDLLRQVMDRVELRDRLLVGAVVALRRQRSLADVDDEERGVEAALLHLREVDLRVEPLRVVLLPREVLRIDVVVRVERDDAVVNGARLLDERGIRAWPAPAPARAPGRRPAGPGPKRAENGSSQLLRPTSAKWLRWASRNPITPTFARGFGGQALRVGNWRGVRLASMRLFTQIALTALACAVAAGCGGSPTAPTATAGPTDPVGTVPTPPPFPAPVSQTLTGHLVRRRSPVHDADAERRVGDRHARASRVRRGQRRDRLRIGTHQRSGRWRQRHAGDDRSRSP